MTIGNQLRQAREARNLSVEQVAQATHIRVRYLQALEDEQFDSLPSATQLRGFLRTYAGYLKLDANVLLAALDGEVPPESPGSFQPLLSAKGIGEPGSDIAIFAEIGQKLQRQRELLGLSIDDVERHTRIRAHYLLALEAGDLAGLPSPVQGKGMLNNYAGFLGLDTAAVLLRFADGLQARLAARQPIPERRRAKSTRTPIKPSLLRRLLSADMIIGSILVISLIAFTAWGTLRINALRSGQAPTSTAPPISEVLLASPTSEVSPTPTVQSVGSTVQVTAGSESSPVPQTTDQASLETPTPGPPPPDFGAAPIQVYIVVHQRAWMRVTVDGEIAYEGRVLPGSAYPFAADERIELVTGNGAALQVFYNQQDLGVLGTFGQVVERVFTIQGVLFPTPAIPPTSTPAPTSTPTPPGTPASSP